MTVQSFPGERASFVGQTTYTNAVAFTNDQGIRIRNLTFAARTNTNLKLISSQHIEVDQILSKDSGRGCDPNSTATCGGQGLLVVGEAGSGYAFPYSDDIQVWNSEFINNGGTNTAGEMHDHPLYMCSSGASYGAGTNNGCHSFVIANNIIHENPTGYGIQLGDQAQNGFVVNNTFDRQGIPSAGLNYAGCGVMVWSTGTFGTHDVLIANNIFTNGVANAVCSSLGKSPTGNMVRNNLAFNNNTNCNFTDVSSPTLPPTAPMRDLRSERTFPAPTRSTSAPRVTIVSRRLAPRWAGLNRPTRPHSMLTG